MNNNDGINHIKGSLPYGRAGVGLALELLAPAKNLECGIAAIDHGADAVYIGAYSFGARHAAGNSINDIQELCSYAHQFGVKVYATVNTVVYNEELDEASKLVDELCKAGVDALLIQDMGLMSFSNETVNQKICFHASTQTDNRSVEKVKWLRSLGFSRVVLARELTLDEIRQIHEAVPDVELEVFVHGALCVSYSGQCYASEVCLGRSANRGCCAQMCRMKYSLEDAAGKRIADDAYYLSLKDLCQIDNLEEIINAGACSLKIEGRLKDVAYVKNVVTAYSNRLNQIIARNKGRYVRTSWGRVKVSFEPDLNRSFNRGYTDYFLHGRRPNIAQFYTPKAIGEYVGKIKSLSSSTSRYDNSRSRSFLVVAGIASFVNGDGLCYIDSNGELKGFRVNRAEGNKLYPLQMPKDLRPGMSLYRSQDQAFDKLLSAKTAIRTIPLQMVLEDKGNELVLTLNGVDAPVHATVSLSLDERQNALKPQLDNIRRQLTKLGGTIYSCESIDIAQSLDMVFVPSSKLAELRRCAIESLRADNSKTGSAVAIDLEKSVNYPTDKYHQQYSYLYNAVNDTSQAFYAARGISVGKERTGELLMQCRHCIRFSIGYCVKHGGKQPSWQEPLFLRLGDGRRFKLEFDCRNCQMNIKSQE